MLTRTGLTFQKGSPLALRCERAECWAPAVYRLDFLDLAPDTERAFIRLCRYHATNRKAEFIGLLAAVEADT